jgi:hypothetical protein
MGREKGFLLTWQESLRAVRSFVRILRLEIVFCTKTAREGA